jgi:hypothetical protein
LTQLVTKAALGEPKSIQLLLAEIRLVENREPSSAQPMLFDETDREVIRQLYERLRNSGEELNKRGTN